MFEIRYDLTDFDDFVRRHIGDQQVELDERDRIIARKYPTLDEVWFAGEPYGTLWMDNGNDCMEVYAYGASAALIELGRGVEALTDGAGSFEASYLGGGYGVALRLERADEQLRAIRKRRDTQAGPDVVETTWPEFTSAVDRYEAWYHTEYVAEASWLLQLGFVQEMRRKAGYPPDGLNS